MTWFFTFDAVFFTGIATMVFGCFAIIIKTALASKCDNLNLCFGCIQIHRRVELESDDSTIPITQPSLNNNEKKNEI
jgi:hypothetical protein